MQYVYLMTGHKVEPLIFAELETAETFHASDEGAVYDAPRLKQVRVAPKPTQSALHVEYEAYFDECEKSNKIPLAFHAWQLSTKN